MAAKCEMSQSEFMALSPEVRQRLEQLEAEQIALEEGAQPESIPGPIPKIIAPVISSSEPVDRSLKNLGQLESMMLELAFVNPKKYYLLEKAIGKLTSDRSPGEVKQNMARITKATNTINMKVN